LERDRALPPVHRRPACPDHRRRAGRRGDRDGPSRRLDDGGHGRRPSRLHELPAQDDDGQIATAHSISAGLDYPGVGPEHAYYRDAGRFEFVSITDEEALEGFQALTRLEGIMPALETAHAVAHAMHLAKTLPGSKAIV